MIKSFLLILSAIIIIIFEFTVSGKIALLNIRPNLILIFFIIIVPILRKSPISNTHETTSLFLPNKKYFNWLDAGWQQFFLTVAAAGFMFDILSIDHKNGFYFIVFLIIGILIYFLYKIIPFKNYALQLIIISIICTAAFNFLIGQNFYYLISQKNFLEIAYNTILSTAIFGLINIKKLFKIIKI